MVSRGWRSDEGECAEVPSLDGGWPEDLLLQHTRSTISHSSGVLFYYHTRTCGVYEIVDLNRENT